MLWPRHVMLLFFPGTHLITGIKFSWFYSQTEFPKPADQLLLDWTNQQEKCFKLGVGRWHTSFHSPVSGHKDQLMTPPELSDMME